MARSAVTAPREAGTIGIGGLYLYDETMLPEQAGLNMLEGYRDIGAITNTNRTGYLRREMNDSWQINGSTRTYWKITPAP